MPLVVQLDAGIDVTPGLLQAPRHRAQVGEALGGKVGNEVEGERLEHGQNGAHLPQLLGGQRPDPEPAADFGFQGALPGQADQGLPDGVRLTPSCLAMSVSRIRLPGVMDAALNALQEIEIDLISEG